MRADRPSLTARVVALSRALASETRAAIVNPGDGAVQTLLPVDLRIGLKALKASGLAPVAVRASAGFVDHIALRAAILDRQVEAAIAAGISQIVILGAGLDTRAHRLTCLEDADVYEVDHPSTQRGKEAAARAGLPTLARKLVYVAVDFERDRLTDRLAQTGHKSGAPTLWLLEGVVPYLTEGALAGLFGEIGAAAAPGSRLVLTYVPANASWLKRSRPALGLLLAIAGEPFQSPITQEALHALLHMYGLSVEEDTGPESWAYTLQAETHGRRIVGYERLIIASKR
jgi:methyltransferase (TIGR00027 family)